MGSYQYVSCFALLLLCPTPSDAQLSSLDVSAGYAALHGDRVLPRGWYADAALQMSQRAWLAVEAGGAYDDVQIEPQLRLPDGTVVTRRFRGRIDYSQHTFLYGVRAHLFRRGSIRPYGQFLVGTVWASSVTHLQALVPEFRLPTEDLRASITGFAWQSTGGLIFNFGSRLGANAAVAHRQIVLDENVPDFGERQIRLTVGLTYRFGPD